MVYLKQQRPEKVTVPAVRASKERGEKLVCLTAYDYPTARIVDEAGTDIILVGDMPYGTYHTGPDDAVRAALRLVKDGGAEAVKLEGGRNRAAIIRRLVEE